MFTLIFFEKNANKLFEIDYWGLGNVEAIKFIINDTKIKKLLLEQLVLPL